MSWWLTQWLCAERHCAYATCWDDTKTTQAEALAEGARMAAQQQLNPWCGICGGSLTADHQQFPPAYRTRAQVVAVMNASQTEQLASRVLLDALGETFDSRRDGSRN